jgi:hypothetical protein
MDLKQTATGERGETASSTTRRRTRSRPCLSPRGEQGSGGFVVLCSRACCSSVSLVFSRPPPTHTHTKLNYLLYCRPWPRTNTPPLSMSNPPPRGWAGRWGVVCLAEGWWWWWWCVGDSTERELGSSSSRGVGRGDIEKKVGQRNDTPPPPWMTPVGARNSTRPPLGGKNQLANRRRRRRRQQR